jgi:hypothetical protein
LIAAMADAHDDLVSACRASLSLLSPQTPRPVSELPCTPTPDLLAPVTPQPDSDSPRTAQLLAHTPTHSDTRHALTIDAPSCSPCCPFHASSRVRFSVDACAGGTEATHSTPRLAFTLNTDKCRALAKNADSGVG